MKLAAGPRRAGQIGLVVIVPCSRIFLWELTPFCLDLLWGLWPPVVLSHPCRPWARGDPPCPGIRSNPFRQADQGCLGDPMMENKPIEFFWHAFLATMRPIRCKENIPFLWAIIIFELYNAPSFHPGPVTPSTAYTASLSVCLRVMSF